MCVFDGHGDDGEYVSKACKDYIPVIFQKNFEKDRNVKVSIDKAF